MAAGKPKNDHEEMRVHVEQAHREVLPAVKLEKKEIKLRIAIPAPSQGPLGVQETQMLQEAQESQIVATSTQPVSQQLPVRPPVPAIIMTAAENGNGSRKSQERLATLSDADRIVGIVVSPHGGVELATEVPHSSAFLFPGTDSQTKTSDTTTKSTTVLPPPSPKLGSRLTVEESHSILEKTENLMEFFEDKKATEKLLKRSSSKKRRTPSPSPMRQSIGLDHLDNLVKLMEQLSNLRDENSRLKNRCDYLESTKTLLVAKSHLDEHEDDDDAFEHITYESNSLPRSKKSKSRTVKSEGSEPRILRPRLPSAEDARCIEIEFGDANSEQGPTRERRLYKRSFSTGSLEVPSDILEQSEDDIGTQRLSDPRFEEKRSSKLIKTPEGKRKSKFSKWAKVKRVLNKQQLQENISSGIKSIKGFGKGAYLRYGSLAGRELTVPHSGAESRSVDSGVGSGMDGEMDVRRSTSSNEPPSPTRFTERHIDVPTPQIEDIEKEGIWLGPPEWIEKEREKERELLQKSTLSESPKSEPGDIGSPLSRSTFEDDAESSLQLPMIRRQSSPMLLESAEEDDVEEFKRSSSCKTTETRQFHEESFHKSDKEKKHRTPWGKMKNIIHTRRDSGKRKHRKGGGRESDSFGFEEVSETDFEVYEEMKYLHEGYLEGPVSRSTPKASPVVFRQKHRDKSPSNSPPGSQKARHPAARKDASKPVPVTSTGSIDVSALLGEWYNQSIGCRDP